MNFRWLLPVLAFALSTRVGAVEPPSVDEQIRETGRAWLDDHAGIGLTIGVFKDGQRQYFNFGSTHVDGNRTPTKDTVYEIGGISKTLSAQILARAIIEGRAALNDEAAKYLTEAYPNLVNDGEPVRLVHLVSNTSQLVDNIPELSQLRAVPGEPLAVTRMRVAQAYTRKEFLRQLHHVAPRLTPGTQPAFSNVGSMLLGVVLEKIHGESFDRILAREIEKPLRMASGTMPPVKLLAQGHTADNQPLPTFGAQMQFPADTLRYSADDLLKYAAWQMVERDASVKLAHKPTWSSPDGRAAMGFSWVLGTSPHGRRIVSTGATYGFASLCELYPDAKVAVVLLVNKSAAGAQEDLRALSARIISLLRPTSDSGLISPPPSSAGVPQPAR
jgi:D-alanyl-D-alanine-carboxypeptidase/D-alanyl-D-alanine-endopeptidase